MSVCYQAHPAALLNAYNRMDNHGIFNQRTAIVIEQSGRFILKLNKNTKYISTNYEEARISCMKCARCDFTKFYVSS